MAEQIARLHPAQFKRGRIMGYKRDMFGDIYCRRWWPFVSIGDNKITTLRPGNDRQCRQLTVRELV
jgi:hypothetical protein